MSHISTLLCILFFIIGCLSSSSYAASLQKDFEKVGLHALNTLKSAEKTIESLVEYLTKPFESDIDKVRVIYRWITNNIS
jgi:hypothetical protein